MLGQREGAHAGRVHRAWVGLFDLAVKLVALVLTVGSRKQAGLTFVKLWDAGERGLVEFKL